MDSSSKRAAPRNSRRALSILGLTALGLAGVAWVIQASRTGPTQTPPAEIAAEPPSAEPDTPQEESGPSGPAAQPSHEHQQGERQQPSASSGRERGWDEPRALKLWQGPPIDTGRQGLLAGCDQGDVASCRQLEQRQEDLLDAQTGGLRAMDLEACATASNRPCVARSRSELRLEAADKVRALCQREGPEMCFQLAHRYGRDETPDQHLIADLWRAACDGGLSRACIELAERHQSGSGVPRDERRALELRERVAAKAREQGDPCGGNPMCFRVSPSPPRVETVSRVILQPQTALDPLEASLDGAVCNQQPCWTLRAFVNALQSCEGGNGSACWQIHLAYEGGRGVHADPAKAAAYEQRALRLRAHRAQQQ